ncbi:hypothetical protein [Arthrobacter sp. efr-133-TYG-120]|uniref:hypothetical protein n=1 Tax=Arthrobacter sp. efr-133-TYG-120 TaxID=3040280 RepID=UPI00254A0E6D|nr:hypothetical protein [Arthrobacter sp. efr-133-TYG-120]
MASGFLSVQGMVLMLDARVEFRHVDQLHAKCFIVCSRGMLGSANLTAAGLGSSVNANRELGVELDRDQLEKARTMVSAWPSRSVSKSDLDDLAEQAKKLPKPAPRVRKQDGDSELLDVERLLAGARDPERSLWVKVEDGAPVLDQWRQEWRFANPGSKRGDRWIGEPAIKTGDLVFIFATKTKDGYVVVEVTTDPELLPEDCVEWAAYREGEDSERWPWVNRTRPRLVPSSLIDFKYEDLRGGKKLPRGSRFGLSPEEFVAGVRLLAQMPTD